MLGVTLERMLRIFVGLLITVLTVTGCSTQLERLRTTSAPQSGREVSAAHPEDSPDGLQSGALFDTLAQMDSSLFEASFKTCDASKANAIFTDGVEFYHDQDGLSVGEQVRENTRRLTASCPAARGVRRTIVPGSLRVYPMQGYGAVQTGTHRFDERGATTSTLAKFVNVWHFQEGRWRLARVLSLDHRAVPAQAQAPVH